ncbi:hypothetical protein JVT61DRAFT_9560 [Boletus reticuloceps]|uniref:HNH nuclease domain-containing protein n=1 Tax=Boletus reticuloceps TaxID=495285 RepID=A0A8I2YGD0_9AGAM|nr:hypothetical protein JVT61DRAFT_9560 [Boletus reticuloceps]
MIAVSPLRLKLMKCPASRPQTTAPPPIVCARVLGHLLRLAPTANPQEQLQREISGAKDNVMLMVLAGIYVRDFLHVFKRSNGPTPAPSVNPSRPSVKDSHEHSKLLMEECNLDHRAARDAAMKRDDYHCLITGWRDWKHGGSADVEAAHIIPASTNKNIGQDGKKFHHSVGVWTILSMFTNINIIRDFSGNRIHRLENIISMNHYCHTLFDNLCLWLKPVEGVSHTYDVHVARMELKVNQKIPERVTFSTKTDYPLPHHQLLALHALCCEVAWMSGAAEYLEVIGRRMEDIKVLSNDGSMADLLSRALALVEVF